MPATNTPIPTSFPAARAIAAEELVALGAADSVVVAASALAVLEGATVVSGAADELVLEEVSSAVKLATSRVPQLFWISVLHLVCPRASFG